MASAGNKLRTAHQQALAGLTSQNGPPRYADMAAYAARRLRDWFSPGPAQDPTGWPRLKLVSMPALRRTPMAPRRPDQPPRSGRPLSERVIMTWRRLLLVTMAAAQTIFASLYFINLLPHQGERGLEWVIGLLFGALFFWVSIGFWTAIAGSLICLTGIDRFRISRRVPDTLPDGDSRIAMVMPIYNEPVERVFAGLRATMRSVAESALHDRVQYFILSDSTDPRTRLQEEVAWAELIRETGLAGRVHYRRRRHRINRKTGNIADFCRRWGGRYDYMMVLDADSVLQGACLEQLVGILETSPQVGIVQTAPVPANRRTLFARVQQFASRVYSPVFSAGLHYWQLSEAQYWGHNALIRLAPFIKYCGLPRMGRGPLGGAILSHDFVEAAYMRRAGWEVWIAYDLQGSYEEPPPNLIEELIRDRRWCEGNLQHLRLFNTPGLHPAHRAGFLVGAMAYLSAPLWFLFLLATTVQLSIETLIEPAYFPNERVLFPDWPIWQPEQALSLFASTLAILIAPKLLAAGLLAVRGEARSFGGTLALFGSVVTEVLVSSLYAPLRMVAHTGFVCSALLGLKSGWGGQSRDDGSLPWSGAIRLFALPSAIATAAGGYLWWLSPEYLWWAVPVLGPIVLSMPVAALSGSRRLGRWAQCLRLYLTPEETRPPDVLSWTNAEVARQREHSLVHGLEPADAIADPRVWAIHWAMSPDTRSRHARIREQLNQTARQALESGPHALTPAQWQTLLRDMATLQALTWAVWMRPNTDLTGEWGYRITQRLAARPSTEQATSAQSLPCSSARIAEGCPL